MSRLSSRLRLIALILCVFSAIGPARAHGGFVLPPGEDDGVKLPALQHGEMVVVERYRAAIMALASRQHETDPDFRRIGNFIALQDLFCAWELMPGSITDEGSPFNECSHADLAAVRQLLVHMEGMRAARTEATALMSALTRDATATDPVLCQFSEEPFTTSVVIFPDWLGILRHLPSLMALVSVMFAATALTLLAVAVTRPPAAPHLQRQAM